ncbi:unnamed protein product [Caenorhabditis bovis]|uniref:Reticulon-like protein n=1 Tax=Caenorhabditis bovis TaxID=2654633 RepID=A0A8S1E3U0_9PELO|nr:unnamed protein product [Caenorhabditis bovis]
MSKTGAVGRGLYALVAFFVNWTLRIGMNVSLAVSVVMTVYAVTQFSKEALKERKEVLDIIYWRDPKKSAVALSLALIALFVLGKYPILSVLAYTGLGVLAATLGFRIFKTIEAQIKKTGGENPFQEILAEEIALPQEKVHAQADVLVEHGTYLANKLKKIVFVESILESAKFGLILWSLTYIASWFSGFTLALLGVIGVFSIPKIYETNQEVIDANLALVSGHLQNVQNMLEEKLPFLRRPVAAEEKKDQ